MRELALHYADEAALRTDVETNLRRGRAFVVGIADVDERTHVVLVVHHPTTGATLRLEGEVVYASREGVVGVGIQLAPIDEGALSAFVECAPSEEESDDTDLLLAGAEPIDETGEDETSDAQPGEEQTGEEPTSDAAVHLHERMRRLSLNDQQRIARGGTLPERIALERLYGPNVWEGLLHNARLTIPEVARIAKKGTLPKPLIEVIAANGAWLQAAEVQRALLSNPRTGAMVVTKVLRLLSKNDLARVPQQTAYPMAVRAAAKKMIAE